MTLIEALDLVYSLASDSRLRRNDADSVELRYEALRQGVALEIVCNFLQQIREAVWAGQGIVEVE